MPSARKHCETAPWQILGTNEGLGGCILSLCAHRGSRSRPRLAGCGRHCCCRREGLISTVFHTRPGGENFRWLELNYLCECLLPQINCLFCWRASKVFYRSLMPQNISLGPPLWFGVAQVVSGDELLDKTMPHMTNKNEHNIGMRHFNTYARLAVPALICPEFVQPDLRFCRAPLCNLQPKPRFKQQDNHVIVTS